MCRIWHTPLVVGWFFFFLHSVWVYVPTFGAKMSNITSLFLHIGLHTRRKKWVRGCAGDNAYLTDSVKSPGLLLLGRARKLPSNPLSTSNVSASKPLTLGWNHLQEEDMQSSEKPAQEKKGTFSARPPHCYVEVISGWSICLGFWHFFFKKTKSNQQLLTEWT